MSEPTTLRKAPKQAPKQSPIPPKQEIVAPKPKTIDFNEITAVVTNLTVELGRKETELANLGASLAAERRRVDVLESILDKFLKPAWRSGEFEFVQDLLEPPAQGTITPTPAIAAPTEPVSDTQ